MNQHRFITGLLSLAMTFGAATGLSAEARRWAPVNISSSQFESHPAFDPLTGDFYFVRSSPAFEGWRILTSRCERDGWSKPEAAAFAGDGVEADPVFTPDGKSVYFISNRTTDGVHRKDLDIWRVDRDPSGHWGTPVRLPEPVNSAGNEWFPRLGPDGWLYFGSDRPGGLGKTDIWRVHLGEKVSAAENLGPAINSPGDEYEPLPLRDGKTLIIMAADGLYRSTLAAGAWSPKVKLGPDVNVNGTEIGALVSASGRSMLFARDTKGPLSGEFFLWHEGAPEDWPPKCPRTRPAR